MKSRKLLPLKIVLFLGAIFIMLSGLNIGLGGIQTLGWGGQKDFLTITNEHDYRIQDSHVRYVGGLWLGIGVLFLVAVFKLEWVKPLLLFSFALIFLGGIMRLLQGQPATTFRFPVLGSLLAELIGMPLLYYWVKNAVRSSSSR